MTEKESGAERACPHTQCVERLGDPTTVLHLASLTREVSEIPTHKTKLDDGRDGQDQPTDKQRSN